MFFLVVRQCTIVLSLVITLLFFHYQSSLDRGTQIYIPVVSNSFSQENYFFLHSEGRNDKYMGFPVPLTEIRI